MSTRAPLNGQLWVISAPSGAGKTSLVRKLLERNPGLRFSTSYTTREPRASEVEGRDYFFVKETEFLRMVREDAFLEHARVFDHFYGTGREHVADLRAAGFTVVLEIDWQGARQVRERAPDSQTVFILPPSFGELERRLRERRTDSAAVIERRLKDARSDMTHWDEFDHVIVNDDFDAALDRLAGVISGSEQSARTSLPAVRGAAEAIVGARPWL
jgi:guanylate kinase